MPTRKEILEMLSAGEIDVTRATTLLNESRESSDSEEAVSPPSPVKAPTSARSYHRWLNIHVSDLQSGKNRVRVRVPLGLVQFGLRVGARFTDEIDPEMIDDLMGTIDNNTPVSTLVEVEDEEDNERVHIFVE